MKNITEFEADEVIEIIWNLLDESTQGELLENAGVEEPEDGEEEEYEIDFTLVDPNYFDTLEDENYFVEQVHHEHDREDYVQTVYRVTQKEGGYSVLIAWDGWDASYGEHEWTSAYLAEAQEVTTTEYVEL